MEPNQLAGRTFILRSPRNYKSILMPPVTDEVVPSTRGCGIMKRPVYIHMGTKKAVRVANTHDIWKPAFSQKEADSTILLGFIGKNKVELAEM